MEGFPQINTPLKEVVSKLPLSSEAVGHKITTSVPVVYSHHSLSDAQRLLESQRFETINYIYVISKGGRLRGVFSISELYRNPLDKKVSQVMIKKLYKVHPSKDQEEAVHIAIENSLKALPVVDDKNNLLGVLPSDQILSIIDQEAHEDYLKFAGIVGKSHKFRGGSISILNSFTQRVPWIIIGTLGGFVTASVITRFDLVLEKHIILASFIPLIAYIANAVGTQTQTLFIRDLATNTSIKTAVYTIRQFGTSFLIAATGWVLILILSFVLWHEIYIGVVIGLAAFLAIMNATFFAILIPRLLNRFRIDPATGSGPFATTIQDFLSMVIYFSVADIFL